MADTQTTPTPTTPTTNDIELIIEDSSCVINANSYVTLDEANKYQTERNRTEWLDLSDNEKKASLIKATQYVDNLYNWKGRRKFESQVLSFPRVMIKDDDGFDVVGIPNNLKIAVMEASFYGSTEDLFSVYTNDNADLTGGIKRQKDVVVGAVETETEYFNSTKTTDVELISKYASLDYILRGLYKKTKSKEVNAKANWRY